MADLNDYLAQLGKSTGKLQAERDRLRAQNALLLAALEAIVDAVDRTPIPAGEWVRWLKAAEQQARAALAAAKEG